MTGCLTVYHHYWIRTQLQNIYTLISSKATPTHCGYLWSSTCHVLPKATYRVPWVFLNSKLTLTRKARSTTHIRIRAHHTPCGDVAHTHFSTQQSHQDTLVPFASLSTISGTFNSLSKVLFIFPSWYLFAIGLEPIFSFGWNLPPALRSNPEERDS